MDFVVTETVIPIEALFIHFIDTRSCKKFFYCVRFHDYIYLEIVISMLRHRSYNT